MAVQRACSPLETGSRASVTPRISRDGAWIAFEACAPEIAGGDGETSQVVLQNRESGERILLSHRSGEPSVPANGHSYVEFVSRDGNVVLFTSRATDLVAGVEDDGYLDVFLFERTTGLVTMVSRQGDRSAGFFAPFVSMSSNGRFVAFETYAGLVPGDTNGLADVYVYDRSTRRTKLVSHLAGQPGRSGNGYSDLGWPITGALVSDLGHVLFSSDGSNLVARARASPKAQRRPTSTRPEKRASVW